MPNEPYGSFIPLVVVVTGIRVAVEVDGAASAMRKVSEL